MKRGFISADAQALRLASKLRRRVKKKAGKLKSRSQETEGARRAALAASRRLTEVIATLEARQSALSALVEQASANSRRSALEGVSALPRD